MKLNTKIHIFLFSIAILFYLNIWNKHLSLKDDEKEILRCGKVIDAKQVSDEEHGDINNYLFQKLKNGEVIKVNVTSTCYYKFKDQIGTSICFSETTKKSSNIVIGLGFISLMLCIWVLVILTKLRIIQWE